LPLEECDSFHEIHFDYLNKSDFEKLFLLMRKNVLEKIIKTSNLSFDELFEVKSGFHE